jgi:hypothetical protein
MMEMVKKFGIQKYNTFVNRIAEIPVQISIPSYRRDTRITKQIMGGGGMNLENMVVFISSDLIL